MKACVKLYSTKTGELQKFLNFFYNKNIKLENELKYEILYENPLEINDIIGTFIDNNDKYMINMWISLDRGIYIYINDYNADMIIRYIFERFPY